jgi:hypothetical protein
MNAMSSTTTDSISSRATSPTARPSGAPAGLSSEARVAIAGLCLAVSLIHVTDQGGFRDLAGPTWLGWGYRALEIGAVLVAGLVLVDRLPRSLTAVGMLAVGAGPFVGYVLTRTTGLPGDSADIGEWGEPLGVLSLVVEGALVIVALIVLLRRRGAH